MRLSLLKYPNFRGAHRMVIRMLRRWQTRMKRFNCGSILLRSSAIPSRSGSTLDAGLRSMKRRVRKKSKLLSAGTEIKEELAPEYDFSKLKLVGRGIYAERYRSGGERTGLVPRVIGRTVAAQQKKSDGIRPPTNERIIEELPPEEGKVARKILDWSRDNFSGIRRMCGSRKFTAFTFCSAFRPGNAARARSIR